jgi:hypothetical protein
VGLFECLFQLVQLKGGESGPIAAVFLARGVITAIAARACGILIVSPVSGGAGLVR